MASHAVIDTIAWLQTDNHIAKVKGARFNEFALDALGRINNRV